MPRDIAFTLSDRDLGRIKELPLAASSKTVQPQSQTAIQAATHKNVETAISADQPSSNEFTFHIL